MFDKHPPFQIDGNFGVTAAIAEMLVQSTLERIVLLPALPKAWESGSMKGLRVKGCATVDVVWEKGVLKECVIRSEKGLHTLVKYGEFAEAVDLEAGEEKRMVLIRRSSGEISVIM